MMLLAAHPLVHVNASLNLAATVLLIAGLVSIKRGNVTIHKRLMLSAFAVSTAFLACYLYYHSLKLTTPFEGQGIARLFYYYLLLPTHVILAMTVPPLALVTIVLGLRSQRQWLPAKHRSPPDEQQRKHQQTYVNRCETLHRRWARITLPIWLYVSVTGVLVYLMLYHLYAPDS